MLPVVVPAVFAVHNVVAKIMVQVATLAPAAKVSKLVVVFVTINMGSG
jgi:hypothetical protein